MTGRYERGCLARRFDALGLAALVVTLAHVTPASGAITWGYTEIPSANLSLLLILDDTAQQVYFQAAGPATQWFSWGYGSLSMINAPATVFGASGQGSLQDVYMLDYSLPPSTTMLGGVQAAINPSSCVSNGRIYYTFAYPFSAGDALHYHFDPAQTNLYLVWAVGTMLGVGGFYPIHSAASATVVNTLDAPRPQFTGTAMSNGSATLWITNVLVSVTNELQFSATLNPASWSALTNLVLKPACGTNQLSQFISVTVPQSNSSSGFFRVKQ
jgi:hypothetical protein